ncbi:MAG TPA: LacI family DNA-binding transcriptional regulator [Chloroflexia bacterium]
MSNKPERSKTKKPSIQDVARLAGVSQTTVSFVVNDAQAASIPPETRERVWSAVKELNWRPNAMARGLISRRSHTIGFVSDGFVSDEMVATPLAGKTIQGVQDEAWANDKMVLALNTGRNRKIERDAIEMLLERQVDGIIYATMFHHSVTPPAAISQVPAVLLDCYAEDRSLPSVVPDEVQGGRAATEVLLEKGHRRVGFINNVDPMPAQAGRLEGYRQALEAHGVAFDPRLVQYGTTTHTSGGYRCAMELMQLPEPPTALFCFNDLTAMGAYDALRHLGLAIPGDVAVVGFDNLELIAAQLSPPLSTMELPHYQMGRWAVRYLLEHADGAREVEPVQHKIACPFIPRSSA